MSSKNYGISVPMDRLVAQRGMENEGLCPTCQKHDLRELLLWRPYGSKVNDVSEPLYQWYNTDFWLSSTYCKFCAFVLHAFETSEHEVAAEICKSKVRGIICRVVLQAFAPTSFKFSPKSDVVRRINVSLITSADTHPTVQQIFDDDEKAQVMDPPSSPAIDFQILADETTGPFRLGRHWIAERVNISLLSKWLNDCEGRHGSICAPKTPSANWLLHLRLIDVKRRCVVDAPIGCQYFALSYTWGDSSLLKHLKLTRDSEPSLRRDGSLNDDNLAIPDTIRDAIQLTEELGQSYLWIDALCILQDDSDDLIHQCDIMHNIYASARLTIVAGFGSDAWAGLPGIGKRSKARIGRHIQATVHDSLTISTTRLGYGQWLKYSTWSTRAWTYQEKICSRRLLILNEYQAFFHCESALWYEDTMLEDYDSCRTKLPGFDKTSSKILESPWLAYREIARTFVDRDIGLENDRLRAFRGLEDYLTPSLTNTFYFGLPESHFDAAISWNSYRFRKYSRILAFPSWTFLGWKCATKGPSVEHPHLRGFSRSATFRIYSGNRGGFRTIKSSLSSLSTRYKSLPRSSATTPESTKFPKEHLLQVWCRTAIIEVSRDTTIFEELVNSSNPYVYYSILNPQGKKIGRIILEHQWRLSKPDKLEFCALSECSIDSITLVKVPMRVIVILIDREDDIATRVANPVGRINLDDWESCKPKWKWITLA